MGGGRSTRSRHALGDEAWRGQIDTSEVDGVVEKQAVVGPNSASVCGRAANGRMGAVGDGQSPTMKAVSTVSTG